MEHLPEFAARNWYLFAALIYFIICFFASFFVKRLQLRITPPR